MPKSRKYTLARTLLSEGAVAPKPTPESLENTVESALLLATPEGEKSFEITIKDEVFHDLVCRISVEKRGVVATFIAPDTQVRRLLQAQTQQLRQKLEARGLKVAKLAVLTSAPARSEKSRP